MKILVADDNVFYRNMLEHTLREWRYEVVAVADGEAAWQALQEELAGHNFMVIAVAMDSRDGANDEPLHMNAGNIPHHWRDADWDRYTEEVCALYSDRPGRVFCTVDSHRERIRRMPVADVRRDVVTLGDLPAMAGAWVGISLLVRAWRTRRGRHKSKI